MQVFVFGNIDSDLDNRVFDITTQIKFIDWVIINPNQDLPLSSKIIILDTISGISDVSVFTEKDIDKIISPPRTTAHDYDLGFQLKYLRKLGKIDKITIVGIPQTGSLDYDLIHSIFKKLVAQDMHGS